MQILAFKLIKARLSVASISISLVFLAATVVLAEETSWRDTNARAIQAMRSEKFEESESLFQKALSECKLPEDRKTVRSNFTILMKKLGRNAEAAKLQQEEGSANSSESGPGLGSGLAIPGSGNIPSSSNGKVPGEREFELSVRTTQDPATSSITNTIQMLDAEIAKADKADNLELLQSLFQKKADAIKVRDKSYSMDYAYTLHFRAQVLHHLKRDTEADAVEAEGARIRDANRQLMSKMNRPISSPSSYRAGSSIRPLNMHFDTYTPQYHGDYTRDYTDPNHQATIDSSHKNTIDRNTTNIQATPGANSRMNSYKNFGK